MKVTTKIWSIRRYEGVVAPGELAESGHIACFDPATGFLTPAVAGNADLVPIGKFDTEPSVTGDGTLKTGVDLFRPVWLAEYANDTGGTPVGPSGSLCFLLDSLTVTGTDGGGTNAAAGRVWFTKPNGLIVVSFPVF